MALVGLCVKIKATSLRLSLSQVFLSLLVPQLLGVAVDVNVGVGNVRWERNFNHLLLVRKQCTCLLSSSSLLPDTLSRTFSLSLSRTRTHAQPASKQQSKPSTTMVLKRSKGKRAFQSCALFWRGCLPPFSLASNHHQSPFSLSSGCGSSD